MPDAMGCRAEDGETKMSNGIAVGQRYWSKETSHTGARVKRIVEVLESIGDGRWRVQIVVQNDGTVERGRRTNVKETTLRSHYELVGA
jgi:argonaute-like protein implicated in RNA metabolism and viral defense